ncbi:membrane metallo-endopeptidase-like 1 [Dermacentor silvarum]|uniref:membrane metallo-endopeptidase-like 1 n=1 Tax=Dermacentor silvarum TaxID=543639 RepID=UPI002100E96D|nr:membrane metallo-endopeptidase-like 1 [Dermacentor silvarum]
MSGTALRTARKPQNRSWGHKLTSSLAGYGRRLESMSTIMKPRTSPRRKSGGDFHTTFSALYPSMDFSDSLWDDRTPLEQLLLMCLCFGLFLLMISATYLAYFSHTYNLPSRRHVFGMEFDVCTKEVCVEHARLLESTLNRSAEPCGHFYEYACHRWPRTVAAGLTENTSNVWTLLKRNVIAELEGITGRLVKQRSGGAKLRPVQETAVQFYQSCTNWTLRNAVGLEPLRDVLSNLSVRYWPLLDVYGEEYNAPRILLRLLLRLRLDVFVSLRVQRSLRNRSHFVLNIDSPRFGLPEGLLRFNYPDKGVVLDHYHDFIVLVARFFRTDVRLSTVAREIVEFEENLAMTVEAVYSEKSFLWSGAVTEHSALNDTVMTPFTEIISKVTERLSGTNRAAPEVVLWSKEYLQYLSHLFHQPVIRRHLINYMTWRVILELGPYTSQLFLDIRQEFLRRVGLASNAPRSEHCLHDLLATLPHTAGWLLRNESASLRNSQKQVERMCEELKATMAHNLDYNEWMTPATRQHAMSKVQRMKFVVGDQNEALVEDTEYQDTYVILVVKLMVSEAEREWQKLAWYRPEFINDVPYSSLEISYDPIYNTVVVPGAMLEPPLYTEGLSPALNFGSLGFLIASKMMSSLIFEGECLLLS